MAIFCESMNEKRADARLGMCGQTSSVGFCTWQRNQVQVWEVFVSELADILVDRLRLYKKSFFFGKKVLGVYC